MQCHESIQPVKPVAPYLGGKARLAKTIIARINQTPHQAYAEPFVGMGGVFLRRDKKPEYEVINDYNGELVNFFRILQRHHRAFVEEMLQVSLTLRAKFNRLFNTSPETLTDLERALRFLYLQRSALGGKVSGRNFGVSPDRPAKFNALRLEGRLEQLHRRLSGVVIENLSYEDFIPRHDGQERLFYLDPPYWGNEKDYGKEGVERADFQKMAVLLKSLKGRFILSLNDRPEVRETFKDFHIEKVKTRYSIAAKAHKVVGEVLITKG